MDAQKLIEILEKQRNAAMSQVAMLEFNLLNANEQIENLKKQIETLTNKSKEE